ncbi:hypothetical protein T10_4276 [Trichinella papuae]|uniref:Uncharacterized protein n=1 Tax=Trichinella papuae TaxID=268474 RepID=A0A0V1MG36_9BILA|nr:hypothetical protein T10_4276 [Trichinella papuae]
MGKLFSWWRRPQPGVRSMSPSKKTSLWPFSPSALSWPEQSLLTASMYRLMEQQPKGRLPVAIALAVVHPREGYCNEKLSKSSFIRQNSQDSRRFGARLILVECRDGSLASGFSPFSPSSPETPVPTGGSSELPSSATHFPSAGARFLRDTSHRPKGVDIDRFGYPCARRSSTTDRQRRIGALLTDFAGVFLAYDGDIGRITRAEHHINIGGYINTPIRLGRRIIPWYLREQMGSLLLDMMNKGIIEPSASVGWCRPHNGRPLSCW